MIVRHSFSCSLFHFGRCVSAKWGAPIPSQCLVRPRLHADALRGIVRGTDSLVYRVSCTLATNSHGAHLEDVLLPCPDCLGERRIWHERRLGPKVGFESGEERHKVTDQSEGPENVSFHSNSVEGRLTCRTVLDHQGSDGCCLPEDGSLGERHPDRCFASN